MYGPRSQAGHDAARARTPAATAEAVARRSYGKLVAFLAARTRDVAAAEDALSEAFAAALIDWPARAIPENPQAWLIAVARRRMIDAARRRRSGEHAAGRLQLMAEELAAAATSESDIPDERLALMFACAHPAIDPGIRAPLILQTILGFDAATIASAFLMSPATMGQRLVRAKNKIRQAGIPFRVPERADLRDRLDSVLAAIYAAFAEGWSDPDRHRDTPSRPGRGGNLAGPAGGLAASGRARGARAVGADAPRRGPPRRAPECPGRIRSARGPGSGLVGRAADRRGGRIAPSRQHHGHARPLSTGGGAAIGPCRPPAHRRGRLGGDRAHL